MDDSGRWPVSVKGVVVDPHHKVVLLRNERGEWELPGGRLEHGETPPQCVAREIAEETGWQVEVGPILDSWVYHIAQANKDVLIVTYGCHLVAGQPAEPVVSAEHKQIALFAADQVAGLVMPAGYKDSIGAWYALTGAAAD